MAHSGLTAVTDAFPEELALNSLLPKVAPALPMRFIIAVDYRVRALAKLVREGEGKPWTYAVTEGAGHMINEACSRRRAQHFSRPRPSG
jgi:hypothetical protein